MTPPPLHFEIGRITLHGYTPAQQARFVDSLRAQLTQLGESDGWPSAGRRTVGRVDAGMLPAGAPPAAAAAQIASTLRTTVIGGGRR